MKDVDSFINKKKRKLDLSMSLDNFAIEKRALNGSNHIFSKLGRDELNNLR